MSTDVILSAEKREGVRKGANRKLRASGRVPAILYGKDTKPALLSVDAHEAERLFQQISVENTIIDLKVKGNRPERMLFFASPQSSSSHELPCMAVRPDAPRPQHNPRTQ